MQSLRIIRFWFPVLVYFGIIFYVSSLSGQKVPGVPYLDKVCHAIEYAGLGFLLARVLREYGPQMSFKMAISCVVLVSTLYGLSDEYHQSFVAGRNSDITDAIADSIGSFLGSYIFLNFYLKVRNRSYGNH